MYSAFKDFQRLVRTKQHEHLQLGDRMINARELT